MLILLIILECLASISWGMEFLDVNFILLRSQWPLGLLACYLTKEKLIWEWKCW